MIEHGLEVPMKFLVAMGVFEIPPPDCGEVNLTAMHLSYVEFLAAAGLLMSSETRLELFRIQNRERLKAVSVFARKDFIFESLTWNPIRDQLHL